MDPRACHSRSVGRGRDWRNWPGSERLGGLRFNDVQGHSLRGRIDLPGSGRKLAETAERCFTEWSHQDILSELARCESGRGLSNEELTAALDRLAERVVHVQREYALQASISKMRSSFQTSVAAQAAEQRAAQEAEAQERESAMQRVAEDVSNALVKLAEDVPTAVRAAIEARSEDVIGASTTFRRNALLAQLRLEIRQANEAESERRRRVAKVEEWRDQLQGGP